MSGFGARGNGRKRTQGRLGVRLVANLETKVGVHSAILENISKSGAKLTIEGAPATGSEVILRWHGHEMFGHVCWTTSTSCGVAFASAVSPAALQAALAIDEIAHVPDELDAGGAAAKEWFDGGGRFGFD